MKPSRVLALILASSGLSACGGRAKDPAPESPYALQLAGGVYDDGSGLPGVAVLATFRDAAGDGPASTWSGTLSDGAGTRSSVSYDDAGVGSYRAAWWPSIPYSGGTWSLSLSSGPFASSGSLLLADPGGLAPPVVSLTADGAALAWAASAGAATYECRIAGDAGLVRAGVSSTPGCAVGDLPDGGYSATILAYSADLEALRLDTAQRPVLPAHFDVSEGRLSFLRAASQPVAILSAAGGALDMGLGTSTLTVWLSIQQVDGSPTTVPWTIAVTGPNLPDATPMTFTYPANFGRIMRWSYDQPATEGRYTLVATSSLGTVNAAYSIGAPPPLGSPANVTAADGALGSARIAWTPVTGARSYLVGVWQGADFVTSQWVSGPPADFPQGTFTAGLLYDVYVAATDADMVGGGRPSQVAVTENTLQPAGFVAR